MKKNYPNIKTSHSSLKKNKSQLHTRRSFLKTLAMAPVCLQVAAPLIVKKTSAGTGYAIMPYKCTNTNDDTDCLECFCVCPVDCIRLDDNDKPYIITEECVSCGACMEACPQDVFFIIND